MNPEVKKKWIKALRSGKYKQGYGLIFNEADNTYFCLGVLAKVTGHMSKNKGVRALDYLPCAGISFYDARRIAFVNDSGKYTFNDIATLLEMSVDS